MSLLAKRPQWRGLRGQAVVFAGFSDDGLELVI